MDAALNAAASGRAAVDAAAVADTRSAAQLSRALQRAVRLSVALAAEFARGAELAGPGWQALLALTAPGELCGYAIVQATWQARRARDSSAAAAPPPSYHLAPLEVRSLCCSIYFPAILSCIAVSGILRPGREHFSTRTAAQISCADLWADCNTGSHSGTSKHLNCAVEWLSTSSSCDKQACASVRLACRS